MPPQPQGFGGPTQPHLERAQTAPVPGGFGGGYPQQSPSMGSTGGFTPMGGDGGGQSMAKPKHVPIDDPLLNAGKALFSGVKSVGLGLFGAVSGQPTKQFEDGKDEYSVGEENTFYYCSVEKRWKQKGDTSTVDVSNLDPMTGRPKLPPVTAPPPPPPAMGGGAAPTSGLNRKGGAVGSLYVNPMAGMGGPPPPPSPSHGMGGGMGGPPPGPPPIGSGFGQAQSPMGGGFDQGSGGFGQPQPPMGGGFDQGGFGQPQPPMGGGGFAPPQNNNFGAAPPPGPPMQGGPPGGSPLASPFAQGGGMGGPLSSPFGQR
eukprot:gnl/MRDRNA2_/MRDRNA2_168539_c0_seq1.p1 gnl/MRDRNA2_/MRDRNA2_168539_c0~~gnl/MRDRNA2_/MRDRNA2_168539_c0_seq1.p1  ORF type:complete len:348 (-),score=94.34 gnl/MRDRNA2_/MRDRNA2_168539_c0_seq1:20-961(-)